jgi:hypothetical protein
MAVATAVPAVVTSYKVAIPGEMAAVELSPVKSSATMASAAVGECNWCDRKHSGNDQSDDLKSVHYRTPFASTVGRSSWNDNRIPTLGRTMMRSPRNCAGASNLPFTTKSKNTADADRDFREGMHLPATRRTKFKGISGRLPYCV